ncbi:MAG: hypothetical protein LQ345_001606 [Seirophora villosa]|nr:MAG: hypothetical protein LQ345_001606 [Seirophora villosa]
MDLPPQPQEFIEITDDSDDDESVRLEDFMTSEELNAVLQDPSVATPRSDHQENHHDLGSRRSDAAATPTDMSYEACLAEVLDVFPDVSHDHVRALYDARQRTGALGAEGLISHILDEDKYPKERDRLNELKRKRMSELNEDEVIAAVWKSAERLPEDTQYSVLARNLLQEDFPEVPQRFIDLKYKELGHLYATYLALDLAEVTYDSSTPRPYAKLKKRRRTSNNQAFTSDETSPYRNAHQKMREELGAARAQRKKLQTQRNLKKAAADAEAAEEKALRDSGQVMECACCFDNDVPINKITWCSADVPHAFCLDCAAHNANTQIGFSRFLLTCMDSSGCKEIFSRDERRRFLDTKTIDKIDRLQQQTELREANISNLETCPFCDFAAICDPVEVDKEFRCSNPDCEKVSCRKCRNVTHVPLSCAEFKKESGVSERHQIEEARTQALLRQCPKCKSAIFKDGGCNKIACSCGGAVCDYCGKDITKEKYLHFRDGPTSVGTPGQRGKCPTHDNDYERNQQNMEKAEKETMEKIRQENPDLSEEDLRIKFRENVKTPPRNQGYPFAPGGPYIPPMHLGYQYPLLDPDHLLRVNRGPQPGLPMPPHFPIRHQAGHPHYQPPNVRHPDPAPPAMHQAQHHPLYPEVYPPGRRNALVPPPAAGPALMAPPDVQPVGFGFGFDFDVGGRADAPPLPRPRNAQLPAGLVQAYYMHPAQRGRRGHD